MSVKTSDWQMRVMENGTEPYVHDKGAAMNVQYNLRAAHFRRIQGWRNQ
jgi:hypothetical protein